LLASALHERDLHKDDPGTWLLPGRSSPVDNGHRLAQAIRLESARPQVERIVVVAFSKGVPDSLRALAIPLPGNLRYDTIVAHAAPSETAVARRPFRGMLDAIDLHNDGQVIATDAILPGSTLLAEARADHGDIALPPRPPSRCRVPSPDFGARLPPRGAVRGTDVVGGG
jgi:hypothetical protein